MNLDVLDQILVDATTGAWTLSEAVRYLNVLPRSAVPNVTTHLLRSGVSSTLSPATLADLGRFDLFKQCPRSDIAAHLEQCMVSFSLAGDVVALQWCMDHCAAIAPILADGPLWTAVMSSASSAGRLAILDWAVAASRDVPRTELGSHPAILAASRAQNFAVLEWWVANSATVTGRSMQVNVGIAAMASSAQNADLSTMRWWNATIGPDLTVLELLRFAKLAAMAEPRLPALKWIWRVLVDRVPVAQFRDFPLLMLMPVLKRADLKTLEWWAERVDQCANGSTGNAFEFDDDVLVFPATTGNLDVLEFWWNMCDRHSVLFRTSSLALWNATVNGHTSVLSWFADKQQRHGIPMPAPFRLAGKDFQLMLDVTSGNGQVASLEWWAQWLNRPLLPVKHFSSTAIALASAEKRLAVLDWWWAKIGPAGFHRASVKPPLDVATLQGDVKILNWWVAHHDPPQFVVKLDQTVLTESCAGGSLEALQWWRDRVPIMFTVVERAAEAAVARGHIALRDQWAAWIQRPIDWHPRCIARAPVHARIELLTRWLQEHPIVDDSWDEYTLSFQGLINTATFHQNTDLLAVWRTLAEQGRLGPLVAIGPDAGSLADPTADGSIAMVSFWWRMHLDFGTHFPHRAQRDSVVAAARSGHLRVMRWWEALCCTNQLPFGPDEAAVAAAVKAAGTRDHLSILQWLWQRHRKEHGEDQHAAELFPVPKYPDSKQPAVLLFWRRVLVAQGVVSTREARARGLEWWVDGEGRVQWRHQFESVEADE